MANFTKGASYIFPILFLTCCQPKPGLDQQISYPTTKKIEVTNDYHGTLVNDPYRWLETPIDSSKEVRLWVDKQNQLTTSYLNNLPHKQKIKERLEEIWDFETFSRPKKGGNKYFYFYNDGTEEQSLVYELDHLNAEPRELINPKDLSSDGTTSITEIEPSPDGRYLAYAIQNSGSDWRTFRIIDLKTRELLPDKIERIKYSSLRWLPDGSGFFYSAFLPPEHPKSSSKYFNRRLYFHKMYTSQEEDELAFEGLDSEHWAATCRVSSDGRFLVIYYGDTQNRENPSVILVKDLKQNNKPQILTKYRSGGFDLGYMFVGNFGNELFFLTSLGAANNQIVSFNFENRSTTSFQSRVVVPETSSAIMDADFVGGYFVVHYLKNVFSEIKVFQKDGAFLHDLNLPGIGIASGFDGGDDDPNTFFSFSSLNSPTKVYQYNVAANGWSLFRAPELSFDPNEIVLDQVFYPSKDGTSIPMFIVYKKSTSLDGNAPTLLHGYGGFGVTKTPRFEKRWLSWIDLGGVFAMANIRGGNEYGQKWHDAAKKGNKQNAFDDFVAAAEYLIKQNYTSKNKLAIAGESNGGLLIGAVTNQRPDLFAAALPDVGVMDMLRFQKFNLGSTTIGEYGTSDQPTEFPFLYAYSPYHNIKEGIEYPAIMAMTATHDNNVLPGHTLKYIARMQERQNGSNPILLRVEEKAGHFAGRSREQLIDQYTNKWTFLFHILKEEI